MLPNQNTVHETKSIYVVPHLLCVTDGCEDKAIWGVNWAPIHCEDHKTAIEELLLEKRCSSCGRIWIVDKDKRCKKCKLAENTFVPVTIREVPTHPYFSIHPTKPNPQPRISEAQQLRLTKSSYDLKSIPLRSTKSSPEILTSKLLTLQKGDLQIAIVESKKRLAATRNALAQYSLIDNSPMKLAAREAHDQAEKEVEEACKAWCTAKR